MRRLSLFRNLSTNHFSLGVIHGRLGSERILEGVLIGGRLGEPVASFQRRLEMLGLSSIFLIDARRAKTDNAAVRTFRPRCSEAIRRGWVRRVPGMTAGQR